MKKQWKIERDPSPPGFGKLAARARKIQSLGYDDKTAARFSILIGETPTKDNDGNILVIEDGKVVAKLSSGALE